MRQGSGPVAALLGILKAGRIAVVLDVLGPDKGTREILEEVAAGWVFVDRENSDDARSLLPSGCKRLIEGDSDETFSDENPTWTVPTEAPACLIFTSGSTGRPKGVIRLHRNLVWGVQALTGDQALTEDDRYCFLAAYNTGNGTANLFRALLRGATVLAFDLREQGIDSLADWLLERRATAFTAPSSVFRYFVQTLAPDQHFPDVRLVRLSSEKALRRDFEAFQRHFPKNCLLENAISCTEAGSFAAHLMNHDEPTEGDTVPIGRPMPGVELRLVDDSGRDVGVDQVGEITVRSPAVAPGYWRRPDLTAAAFRRGVDAGSDCQFHTGDLAIRHQDGCLVYVGRRDLRVKIRGLGVDLQGVEAALGNHPGVRQAAVTVRSDRDGEPLLVAFIVAESKRGLDPTELRGRLRRQFPEPMLPSEFIFVESFPRTSNGKLDRVALTSIQGYVEEIPRSPVKPMRPPDVVIAGIWHDVLRCGPVGVRDSFYELGGHSLAATRVLARVWATFQVTVPLRRFLENPTVCWLADRVMSGGGLGATPEPAAEPLRRRGSNDEEFPLSFQQQRLWFHGQLHPHSTLYNLPWAMRLLGVLNVEILERSLREIIRRHETFRTVFRMRNGEGRQVISRDIPMRLEIVDLSSVPVSEREMQCRNHLLADARQPFDLERGPVWRVALIRLAREEHVLRLTMHHILSDRWSKAVLTDELTTLYSAFLAGGSSPLPDLEIQYGDFAVWQRQPGYEVRLGSQLNYWKHRLEGLEPLDLSTDRPRPARASSQGSVFVSWITESIVAGITALGTREHVSLYGTLLAAFQLLLHRFTGQVDVAVGTVIGNRQPVQLERLIGFFVNTLVLRGDVSGDPPFRDFLRQLWSRVAEDFEHSDVPFDRLVAELHPPRDLSRHPLFGILFTLQNMPRQHFALPGLEIEPLEVELETAKFDLSVTLFVEGARLRARWEYRTDLFDAATIHRLASAFQTLLQGVCDQPLARLSELPLVPPGPSLTTLDIAARRIADSKNA